MKAKKSKTPAKEAAELDIPSILKALHDPLNIVREGFRLLSETFEEKTDPHQRQLWATIQNNLEQIEGLLKSLEATRFTRTEGIVPQAIFFDLLRQVQQVCGTHDTMFLQKQQRFHLSAAANLPQVYAQPEQILVVLSHLMSNAVKHSPRGSGVEIKVREANLRQGSGVEVTIINPCEDFSERDRFRIFEKFFGPPRRESSPALGLAVCKEIIQKAGGQLWVDIPAKGKVGFTFVLPCAEISSEELPSKQQTFKYDISISNYKDIREKFGGQKGEGVLAQVEEQVRHLVRHPIDVVASFENSGIISTIYETSENNAGSVAARISQRLGKERFYAGKEEVPIVFQYNLTILQ